MGVEPGIPETLAEFTEFNLKRFTSGPDGKEGSNVFVISAIKVSGETVVAKVSGETVYLGASGMGQITAKSGSLDPNVIPLHVLTVSGSIAGAGADPVTIRSGTTALFSSGMAGLITSYSGSLDAQKVPLHVLVVSGGMGIQAGQPVRVSGEATRVATVAVTIDDSETTSPGLAIDQAGSTISQRTYPLAFHGASPDPFGRIRMVQAFGPTSGFPLAVGFASGWFDRVQMSGQEVRLGASGMGMITAGSGSLDPNTNPLHVLPVSGGVVSIASGLNVIVRGDQPAPASVGAIHLPVLGAFVEVTVTPGTDGTEDQVSLDRNKRLRVFPAASGELVRLATSGMPAITSRSGSLDPNVIPLHVLAVSGSIAGAGADPVTVRSGTTALFASGMGLLTARSGSLDPNVNPLHVLVVSGSIAGAGADPVTVRSGMTALFSSGMAGLITSYSGSLDTQKVPLHVLVVSGGMGIQAGQPVRVSGEVVIISGQSVAIGHFLPVLTSGEEVAHLLASGEQHAGRLDLKGIQVVRIDRVHVSGGYARYDRNIVTAQGDTVLETPGSGRALRVKAIQDSYMGNSGAVLVAYRFGAPPAGHFLRHQVGANFPNWGINLVGAEIQGAIGAELRMNLNVALSSGVEFTAVIEEVGSGALF